MMQVLRTLPAVVHMFVDCLRWLDAVSRRPMNEAKHSCDALIRSTSQDSTSSSNVASCMCCRVRRLDVQDITGLLSGCMVDSCSP